MAPKSRTSVKVKNATATRRSKIDKMKVAPNTTFYLKVLNTLRIFLCYSSSALLILRFAISYFLKLLEP